MAIASSLFFIVDLEEEGVLILPIPKEQVVNELKNSIGKVDLVIYSLASPRRTDPKTGEVYNSVLKPIGNTHIPFGNGTAYRGQGNQLAELVFIGIGIERHRFSKGDF